MSSRKHLFHLLFALAGLGSQPLYAQQAPKVATRIDSLRAAREPKAEYFPALLTFVSGKQVKAYLEGYTTCFLERVECYEIPPEQLPRPALKAVSVERLTALQVDGHRFESLRRKGKSLGLLAENVAKPGPMELFGYAQTKNDMMVPIPLPVGALWVSTGTHEKYTWFVRLNGGQLERVPPGNGELAGFMAKMCQAQPALVVEIQDRPRLYKADNLQDLVNKYNAAAVPTKQ